MTHDRWLRPPRSPTIVGRAVATIVWSSAASSITSIRPPKITRRWGRATEDGAETDADAADMADLAGDPSGATGTALKRALSYGI